MQGRLRFGFFERLGGRMVVIEGYSLGRVPCCDVRALASACEFATSPVVLSQELRKLHVCTHVCFLLV